MNGDGYLNEIVKIAEKDGAVPNYQGDEEKRCFGFGDDGYSFVSGNIKLYNEYLDKLYRSDDEVYRTCYLPRFESKVIEQLWPHFEKKSAVPKGEAKKIFEYFKAEPLGAVSVFRDVCGVTLGEDSGPVELGPFRIYDYKKHINVIREKLSQQEFSATQLFMDGRNIKFLIEFTTEARHSERALENADVYFEKFDNVMRYIIGRGRWQYEVAVLNQHGRRNRGAYMLSEVLGFGSAHGGSGAFDEVAIDHPRFKESRRGRDYLWELVGKEKPSGSEKKLLLAIEWLGQAYAELSPSSAFLKAAISIEILFAYNESTIITPSILSQIAESLPFLLKDSVDERLAMEARVKRLYSQRSAIVHAGKSDISKDVLEDMLDLCREVTWRFLTHVQLRALTSSEDLHAFVKRLKFGGPSI